MYRNMPEEIKEYSVIKIVALNPSVPDAEIGDIGTVLMIFGGQANPEAFEIECVNSDATNKWIGAFLPEHIALA